MRFQVVAQLLRRLGAIGGEGLVAARQRHLAEAQQHVVEEEPQPHAFAATAFADPVHAIVPVASADQRQAALAQQFGAALQGQHAVLVERLLQAGMRGQVVIRLLVRIDQAALDEAHAFVQHRNITGDLQVTAGGERQPQVVVGTARAHAATLRRMPPVQHVALRELVGRAEQQVLAGERRLGMHGGHGVLQLVAKAKGAAGLVVAAARDIAAGQGLVQQPAIGQRIDAGVGRLHPHRAERVQPVDAHAVQCIVGCVAATGALRELEGLAMVLAHAKAEHDLVRLFRTQQDRYLDRRTRVHAHAKLAGQLLAQQRCRMRQAAVTAQEFVAIGGEAAAFGIDIEERHAPGKIGVVGVARGQYVVGPVQFADHVHLRLDLEVAQHPFHVAGGRQPAWTAREVAQLEHRELDRVFQRHVNPQFAGDAVFHVLEHAVAEPVARAVAARAATRQRHRRPHPPILFVAQVERLTAGVRDRVVVPGRQPELVRVLEPGVARRAFAEHGAQFRVGHHVGPGGGRGLAFAQDDHVLAAIGREGAGAVVKQELVGDRFERPRIFLGRRGRRRQAQHRLGCGQHLRQRRRTVGKQQRGVAFRRHVPPDLGGQRATLVADDHPRHGLHQDAVFQRDLLRRAYEDAARAVQYIALGSGRDQPQDLLLQLLAVTGLVLVPDHQVHVETLQSPVRMRLHHLPHQLDVGRIGNLQQHDRQVAGNRMPPQPRLPAPVLHQHRTVGPQERVREHHQAGQALVQLRVRLRCVDLPAHHLAVGPAQVEHTVSQTAIAVLVDQRLAGLAVAAHAGDHVHGGGLVRGQGDAAADRHDRVEY